MKIQYFLIVIAGIFWLCNLSSCRHSPIMLDDDEMMIDTTENPMDTILSEPCDSNVVYFELEILPILVSNCAFSGCHDAASAQDGVILDSYANVITTADVEPFDLQDSEIYEVLVENDEEKRMPPIPTPPLAQDKIQLIAKWILQGAENLECDPDADGCETENISYSADIVPLLDTHCIGCHSGNPPLGGYDLSQHDGVKLVVDNGKMLDAIRWEPGTSNMPQGGEKLSDCAIDKIKSWIEAGALNN